MSITKSNSRWNDLFSWSHHYHGNNQDHIPLLCEELQRELVCDGDERNDQLEIQSLAQSKRRHIQGKLSKCKQNIQDGPQADSSLHSELVPPVEVR